MIKSSDKRQDQYIIKDLNDGTYKVIAMKSLKMSGYEKTTLEEDELNGWLLSCGWMEKERKQERPHDERMRESLSRSRRLIWEYARCNAWEYFVTLTLDEKKVNRKDLAAVVLKMGKMIQRINQSVTGEEWGRTKKIEYVIVPELHKDGSVHFHGLMKGFHKSDIRVNEHGYKEWRHWRDNFGFCNLQEIKDREKVCSYITKYVTKDMIETVKGKGLHTFYASHGLEKPYVIYKGYGEWKGDFDYVQEDGYCKTRICGIDELRNCFISMPI